MVKGVSATFDTDDIFELSRAALEETENRLRAIPEELSLPFNAEARTLEQHLLQMYRTVALCARKEQDLDKIASWWAAMTKICDEFARKIERAL